MFSALRGLVGSGDSKFGYVAGDALDTSGTSMWKAHHGTSKADGTAVTIFSLNVKEASEAQVTSAKNAVKRMKMLRHPNFVRYVDSLESDSTIQIATEPVVPLVVALNAERNDLAISWGIHQIAKAIEFLSAQNMLHRNICISSIVVDLAGEWKLAGLELLHAEADAEDQIPPMETPEKYAPPELAKGGRSGNFWAGDMWALGCLIWEVYNGELERPAELKTIDEIPPKLLRPFIKLISSNPKSRPSPKKFITEARNKGNYLQNDFVDSNLFLDELAIQEKDATSEFYKNLPGVLDRFPEQFCVHRYLPKLLEAFNYGGAGSAVLAPLFKIGKMLSKEEYTKQIVPCVVKLFASTDRKIRINLLQQLHLFVEYLSEDVVNTQIYPNIATGFSDTIPAMREQTVRSMLLLAPKLSATIKEGPLLQHFAKLQTDQQPGIRTNTTVCLGKIAQHLSQATRDRVLITAFGRASKDSFGAARMAALMAFSNTLEFFSTKDLAGKVLPGICPLTIDRDENVRKEAVKFCHALLKKIEENPVEYAPVVGSSAKEKEDESAATAATASAWAGWAVGGISSAVAAATKKNAAAGDTAVAAKEKNASTVSNASDDDNFEDAEEGPSSPSRRGASKKKSSSLGAAKKKKSSGGGGLKLGSKGKLNKAKKDSDSDGGWSNNDSDGGAGSDLDLGSDAGSGGDGWDKSDNDDDDSWAQDSPKAKKKSASLGGRKVSSPKKSDGWGSDNDDEPSPKKSPPPQLKVATLAKTKTAEERKIEREARKAERQAARAAKGGEKPKKGGLGARKKD